MRRLAGDLRDAVTPAILDKTHILRLIGTGLGLLLDSRADALAPLPRADPRQLELFPTEEDQSATTR
jgi:hypothetical protein